MMVNRSVAKHWSETQTRGSSGGSWRQVGWFQDRVSRLRNQTSGGGGGQPGACRCESGQVRVGRGDSEFHRSRPTRCENRGRGAVPRHGKADLCELTKVEEVGEVSQGATEVVQKINLEKNAIGDEAKVIIDTDCAGCAATWKSTVWGGISFLGSQRRLYNMSR